MLQTDPLVIKALLVVHVVAGFLAFVVAPVVLAAAKGGKRHRRWGTVYVRAMAVVAATALVLALFRPLLFLALVSVFSFYFAFSGVRVVRVKALAVGGSASVVDGIAASVCFAASGALAIVGLVHPASFGTLGPVAVVFGAFGMRGAGADLLTFARKPVDRTFWYTSHLQKLLGSYIAAWTAFSATTLSHVFTHAGIILWLWPSAVGVPAIFLVTAYYRRRFAAARNVRRTVDAAAV